MMACFREVKVVFAIGIDIGGTSVKGMTLLQDKIVDEYRYPTNASAGKEAILYALQKVIDHLLKSVPATKVIGIGVGSAGMINRTTGVVEYATSNLPGWQGFNIKKWIEKRYRIYAEIDNDANVALLGEISLNKKIKREEIIHAMMITLGTGVGGANLFFGQLLHGRHYQSGEWGHVILVPDGKQCNCGKKGCIEQYISGTALLREANRVSNNTYSHGSEIFKQANKDQRLQKIITRYLHYLALVIGNISTGLDPDILFLGGGVIESHPYWWNDLLHILKENKTNIYVEPARHLNKAGMYGAAQLVLKKGEFDEIS